MGRLNLDQLLANLPLLEPASPLIAGDSTPARSFQNHLQQAQQYPVADDRSIVSQSSSEEARNFNSRPTEPSEEATNDSSATAEDQPAGNSETEPQPAENSNESPIPPPVEVIPTAEFAAQAAAANAQPNAIAIKHSVASEVLDAPNSSQALTGEERETMKKNGSLTRPIATPKSVGDPAAGGAAASKPGGGLQHVDSAPVLTNTAAHPVNRAAPATSIIPESQATIITPAAAAPQEAVAASPRRSKPERNGASEIADRVVDTLVAAETAHDEVALLLPVTRPKNEARRDDETTAKPEPLPTEIHAVSPIKTSDETPLPAPKGLAIQLGPRNAARTAASDTSVSESEKAKFVKRVVRAFQSLGDGGGQVTLRLSPPELGSLRLEVSVRNGLLAAQVEAETPQARNMLLENLPALRERLAEQNIKIERFDVDLMNQLPFGLPNPFTGQREPGDREAGAAQPARGEKGEQARLPPAATPARIGGEGKQLNVIV